MKYLKVILSTFLLCGGLFLVAPAQDSITVAIAPEYDEVGGFHRFLFGENYRRIWAVPVPMRIIKLSKEKGGLKVTEKGGGLQTKSLRLVDRAGKEWVIRSIQKYPERGLPPKLRKSIAKDILQDQVVTSHPFAALAVPPLAKALGIEHHNPEIVFVADDPALGEYSSEFANSVMMLEERVPLHYDKTYNTEKIQEKLEEESSIRPDQKILLRARLLDLVIGDWDRHEDQWRWALSEDKQSYLPLPKDRDKVFYTTSGLFPGLLSKQSNKANLQGFLPSIKNINQYNFNNRFFDRYFLNELNEEDWKKEILYVQQKLSDALIEKAVRNFPDTVYALTGKKIVDILKQRRNNLGNYAMEYFFSLSQYIDLPGTEGKETFLVQYGDDGTVSVQVFEGTATSGRKPFYQRSFHPSLTSEIRLYSLGGSDVFQVSGNQKNKIKLHLVGGKGTDSFVIDPEVNNKRRIHIYDLKTENNQLPSSSEFRNRLSKDSSVLDFDRKNFRYNKSGPFVNAFFNLDLGFTVGIGLAEQKQGFRKEPYANRQVLAANYSVSRKSFMFSYDADIKEVVGENDLFINFTSRGPQNVGNFFGLGNNTIFPNKDDKRIEYFRNRFDILNASAGLSRRLSSILEVFAGLNLQYYTSDISNNRNKFFTEFANNFPDLGVFGQKLYHGFLSGFQLNSTNKSLLPDKGISWRTEFTGMRQVSGGKGSFGRLESDMIFYLELDRNEGFVLANRLGGGHTTGSPAFFQQLQLGGPANLRGYAINRFTGTSSFFHNVEARIKLFHFNSYLFPGTVGITGFHDLGRVWLKKETSGEWHRGYGGGLFFLPADLLVIQVLMGFSKEGTQPYISLGMSF